jgi:hypothetical protein
MTQLMPHHENESRPSWLFSRRGLVTAGFLAAIGFLMATGHSAHLLGFSPYLLLLACPLMHIFMHHGHGGHHDHPQEPKPPADVHPRNKKD